MYITPYTLHMNIFIEQNQDFLYGTHNRYQLANQPGNDFV